MRIDKIEIKNFRQYRDVTFNFNNKKNNDMHIILGKNGMGKTNLLNAITWCIYNEEFHLGNKNSALVTINTESLKEAYCNSKKKEEIEVRVTISGNNNTITYIRSQEFNITGINSATPLRGKFKVIHIDNNAKTRIYEDEEKTQQYVKIYLPESIRRYFFFDGEHLDKYFINGQGHFIREAIYNISQVKLLTDMRDRLGKVINELEKSAGSNNNNLKSFVKSKEKLEDNNCQLNSYIKEIQDQIERSKEIIDENTKFLKGSEGIPDKENKLNKILKELDEITTEITEVDMEVKRFVRKYTILFSFYDSLKNTSDIINEKQADGHLPPAIDKFLLQNMLNEHKCLICNRDMAENEEVFVQNLLEKFKISSQLSNALSGVKGSIQGYLNKVNLYEDEKTKLFNKKKKLENKQKDLKIEADEIDAKLKEFSDRDIIRKKHIERTKNRELVEQNLEKIGSYKAQININTTELEKLQKEINKIIKKEEQLKEINDKIDFAKRSKDIVEEIENEIIENVKNKMKNETMNNFDNLIWKKDTYSHITLDNDYNLELYHRDGLPSVGSCSAAERSLLALSFTLALQEVSGYNSMLFIDTPVGRVDTENRKNFANMLVDISREKQVILTFTTSEYSAEIEEILEPVSNKIIELETRDEKETVLSKEN